VIENLENTLKKAKKFVFITGAGISQAELVLLEERTACGKNMIQ
jgi:hypothetical protein